MMRYLALGDSYTIGEKVEAEQNFPNQVYLLLREKEVGISQPRIIAATGWTTAELEEGIRAAGLVEAIDEEYDLVTLLAGVNNQYRGLGLEDYSGEFERLLLKAVRFAGGRKERVIVLSIPDWGVTPFAAGRDRKSISAAIDAFNEANRKITEKHHIYYMDITEWTRQAREDSSLLTGDGLHPSGKEYKRWAEKIVSHVLNGFK